MKLTSRAAKACAVQLSHELLKPIARERLRARPVETMRAIRRDHVCYSPRSCVLFAEIICAIRRDHVCYSPRSYVLLGDRHTQGGQGYWYGAQGGGARGEARVVPMPPVRERGQLEIP